MMLWQYRKTCSAKIPRKTPSSKKSFACTCWMICDQMSCLEEPVDAATSATNSSVEVIEKTLNVEPNARGGGARIDSYQVGSWRRIIVIKTFITQKPRSGIKYRPGQ